MQITCPHCNQLFDINEDMAAHIRDQVRNAEFEKELASRLKLIQDKHVAELESVRLNTINAEREKSNKEIKLLSDDLVETKSKLRIVEMQTSVLVDKAKFEAKAAYEAQLTDMDSKIKESEQELAYYKDLKAKMSTKMVGETLEQHCEIEFNKIRMAAFPRAEFGKDNLVSKESGSKGDYIFREYDENGVEIISIMFEMKNEADTTATKKKNEHFFKELDKDRNEKKCEYAVLVTLLEADNELYNQGIVDVSYQYEKMYVIRPQFFIPMITLLRNAALKSLEAKQQLAKIENQNLDIKKFKDNFDAFKTGFGYNCDQANKRLNEAVDDIDKAIKKLESIKASLLASDKQLSMANRKIDDMTVEKLCKDSPTLLSCTNN